MKKGFTAVLDSAKRHRIAIGLCLFLAVSAFFILSEHRAHYLGALPYLLFLACPLMHIFMHHGQEGGHSGDHGTKTEGHEHVHEDERHEHGDHEHPR